MENTSTGSSDFSQMLSNDIEQILKRVLLLSLSNSSKKKLMFNVVSRTWNPITGCLHYCKYCWARSYALSKLKNSQRYAEGFKPCFNHDELIKEFHEGEIIFVCDMGDIFSPHVHDEWILKVLEHIRKYPNTIFLFLTKNPARYRDFIDVMPPNAILGSTIETNKDDIYIQHRISYAPLPSERYKAMRELKWPWKMISVEPILEFDIDIFIKWIEDIAPIIVYVGYDNYGWRLPEPPLSKTLEFIEKLKRFTTVVTKTLRPAWYESNSSKVTHDFDDKNEKDYDSFRLYLNEMNIIALKILNDINDSDRKFIYEFFKKYYPGQKEHYWTLKKLFSLAMYIPMFLQIGLKKVEEGYFDGVVYVDTHAGPGLAKIGDEENEIVLGSPLLALLWPQIVAQRLNKFQKIYGGFDMLIFIEKDLNTFSALIRTIKGLGVANEINNKIFVKYGDCNYVLKSVKDLIFSKFKRPLILLFVDPFGELSDQLMYKSFFNFVRDIQADIIMIINAPSIARGLSSKISDKLKFRNAIEDLWGDLCDVPRIDSYINLCNCLKEMKCDISVSDVLNAYKARFEMDQFRFIHLVPVKYRHSNSEIILYHILFASKGRTSHTWLGNYIRYLESRVPDDYMTLKNIWLQALGRQKDLSRYIWKK